MATTGTPSIVRTTSVMVLTTVCGTSRDPTSVVPDLTHCVPGASGWYWFVLKVGSTKFAGSNSKRVAGGAVVVDADSPLDVPLQPANDPTTTKTPATAVVARSDENLCNIGSPFVLLRHRRPQEGGMQKTNPHAEVVRKGT